MIFPHAKVYDWLDDTTNQNVNILFFLDHKFKYDVYYIRYIYIGILMKTYLISLTDKEHSTIKIVSAQYGVSMREFIVASIRFYIDSLQDDSKKINTMTPNVTIRMEH